MCNEIDGGGVALLSGHARRCFSSGKLFFFPFSTSLSYEWVIWGSFFCLFVCCCCLNGSFFSFSLFVS